MKLFKVFLTFCLSSFLISCNTAKDLLKGIKNENNTDVNVSDDEKKEEDNNPSSGGSSNNPSQGGSSSTPTKKKYTINFFNGDDKLGFLTLDEGTTVGKNTYPNIPTYTNPDIAYNYTFLGWNFERQPDEVGEATSYVVSRNDSLYAVFSKTIKTFDVTFYNDTTLLGNKSIEYGTMIGGFSNFDFTITKTSVGKNYAFIGWNEDKQPNDVGPSQTYEVTRDMTLYAVFNEYTNIYKVTFYNGNKKLGDRDIPHGNKIELNNTYSFYISKDSTTQYDYTFIGWNKSSTATSASEYTVTANIPALYAIFKQTTRQYMVTFRNDNVLLDSKTLSYGSVPSYTKPNPQKNSVEVDGTITNYTFVGWYPNDNTASPDKAIPTNDLPVVKGKVDYYAIFRSSYQYKVVFMLDGVELKTDTVDAGNKPSYNVSPTKDTTYGVTTYKEYKYEYTFVGWSTDPYASESSAITFANLPKVNNPTTYHAIFRKTTKYKIAFQDYHSRDLYYDYYLPGEHPVFKGTTLPTRDDVYFETKKISYIFYGWNIDGYANHTSEGTYKYGDTLPAVETKSLRYKPIFYEATSYKISFYNDKEKKEELYSYFAPMNETIVYNGPKPTKAHSDPNKQYVFKGWNTQANGYSEWYNGNNKVGTFTIVWYAQYEEVDKLDDDDDVNPEYDLDIDNINVIELDNRGLTGNSAFDNKITIPFGSSNTSSYDITCSLDNEGDSEFFKVTNNSDSVKVEALDSGRFTYLNVVYKNKGTTTVANSRKIKLLSNTTDFYSFSNYNVAQLGECTIPNNTYVEAKASNNTTNCGSGNDKYDLVIPSKVNINGVIKEVGVYSTYPEGEGPDYYYRRVFLPSTLFCLRYYALSKVRCKDYAYFSKSQLGFLFCYANSIIKAGGTAGNSYFLLEKNEGANPQSRIFAGTDYYNFPYTKRGYSNTDNWNSGKIQYTNWNWQEDYVSLYSTSITQEYRNARLLFVNNNVCFTN